MKNLYWLGALLVIVGGVYFSIQYGVKPKAVAVVKPSNFEKGERVGEIIYRQLFPLMEKYRIVALGQNNLALANEIVEGLTTEAKYGPGFQRIVSIEETITSSSIPVTIVKRATAEVLAELTKDKTERILLIGLSGDTPHFHSENMISAIEATLGEKILSFSMTPFDFNIAPRGEMEEECRSQSKTYSQFSHLSCLSVKKTLWMRRDKKVDRTKPAVIIERQAEDDFVIYISQGQKSS
jgi:hypothetical protein